MSTLHMPYVNTGFKYNNFIRYKFDREFGEPMWRNRMLHKLNDLIIMSYNGERIAEFHKDDTIVLTIPKNMTHGVTSRMNEIFNGAEIQLRKKTRVNGITAYECSVLDLVQKKQGYGYTQVLRDKFDVNQRIKVTQLPDGGLTFERADNAVPEVEKDNVKYREFNKKLKAIKTILIAQVKMGATNLDEKVKSSRWTMLDESICRKYFDNDRYPVWQIREQKVDDLIATWMEYGPQKELTEDVLRIMLSMHSSDASESVQNLVRRINSACKAAQGRFLRRECITILTPNNSMSLNNEHDTNCELLPSN